MYQSRHSTKYTWEIYAAPGLVNTIEKEYEPVRIKSNSEKTSDVSIFESLNELYQFISDKNRLSGKTRYYGKIGYWDTLHEQYQAVSSACSLIKIEKHPIDPIHANWDSYNFYSKIFHSSKYFDTIFPTGSDKLKFINELESINNEYDFQLKEANRKLDQLAISKNNLDTK